MPIDDDTALTQLNTQTVIGIDARAAVSLSMVAENMLRLLPDPAFVIDPRGYYLYVGEVAVRLLDTPASAFIGKTVRDMGFPDEVAANLAAQTEQVFRTGQPAISTDTLPTIHGPRWYDHHYSPMLDDRGEVVAVLCIAKDVTERVLLEAERIQRQDVQEARRETEEALREQQELYRLMVENAQEGIVLVGSDATFEYVNPVMAQMLGCSVQELVGRSAYDFVFPEDVPEHRTTQARRKAGEAAQREVRLRRNDGSELWTHISSNPILDAEGRLLGVLGLHTDLTERRKQEAEIAALHRDLQRRLQEIETIFRTVPAALCITEDTGCREMRGNPAAYEMLRLPEGANLSKTGPADQLPPFRVYHKGQEARSEDLPMQFAARTGQEVRGIECDIVWDDGVTCHWYGGASPLFDETGATRGSVGAFIDITERKQAEDGWRENAHLLQRIAEVTPGIIHVFDLQERRNVFINRTVAAVLGYHPDDIRAMGAEVISTLMHPEDLPRFEQHLMHVRMLGDAAADFEYRMRDRAGTWHWFQSRDAVFLRDAAGNVRQIIGTALEVTEHKQAEETLRLTTERFELALQDSNIVVFNQDLDLRYTWIYNPALGYNAEEVIGKLDRDLFERREDAAVTEAIKYEAIHAGTRQRQEVRIYAAGVERYYDLLVDPLRNHTGGIMGVTCVAIDTTERKQAEKALRLSEERLRLALDAGSMATWDWNIISDTHHWSEGMYPLLGYEPGSIEPSYEAWAQRVLPYDLPKLNALFEQTQEQGIDFCAEYRVLGRGDEVRWVEERARSERDVEGRVVRSYGVVMDITERKLQQGQIVDLNARLQRSVTEAHHRIKNNLQVLNAMVDMRVADGKETVPVSELTRLGQHIRTLATIHDMLTIESKVSADRDAISLRATLEKITPMLQVAGGGRKFTLRADDIMVPLKQAGAFALLVNELVSNALKHGQGEIEVTLALSPRGEAESLIARLEVCDDGSGFPVGFDPKKAANTGLELIESLGRWDLRGDVIYKNRAEGGAQVVVTFPLLAAS